MRKNVFVARRVCVGVVQNCILILTLIAFAFPGTLRAGQDADPKLAPQNVPTGPRIWLAERQALRVQHAGATADEQALAQRVAAGKAVPLAMAKGDFDGDGYEDLVVGYSTPAGGAIALHRGNIDAFAPQSEALFQAIGRGEFPSPFLLQATVFKVPVQPDFIATGDFTGFGHLDLVIAALGGTSVYVLPGLAGGKFGAPQQFQLSGSIVTTLAAKNLGIGASSFSNVLVGLSSPAHVHSLLILGGSEVGLTAVATFPLSGAASNIKFGEFGDSHPDAVFVAGSDVVLLHSASMQLEPISVPVSAVSIALGTFIYDRNPQLEIAVLDSTGSVHIVVRDEFDPHVPSQEELATIRAAGRRGVANPLTRSREVSRNGWKIVESVPGLAHVGGPQPPVMFSTRISDHGADDVAVINPVTEQLHIIAHPDNPFGAATFLPAQVSSRPYRGSPVAAISTRVNIDGRPGIIAVHAGETTPSVMMPLPDPTFFVNRTDDPTPGAVAATCNNVSNADVSSSCSVREAVLKANATAGTDTIVVAAGTYTLTIARQAGDNSGAHGGLYINDSVNIVGAAQNSTIIQGGTSAATGVDLVFAVNEDIQTITNASASFSNLTIKFGHNRGSVGGTDGDGGCMEYDTGSSGAATLSLTNVTVENCVTQDGNGGGIAIFNFILPGTGAATISNSIFQNNAVAEVGAGSAGSGGGIWVADLGRMTLSNSQVLNNAATQVNGGGRGTAGGLLIFGAGPGEGQIQIHSSTISGNSAAGEGGGINSTRALLIDGTLANPTVISGNAAGANNGGTQVGGGLYLDQASPDTATLTKVTITGNTATGNGGGIAIGNDNPGAGPVTIHFSRIAGNTGVAGSNNLDNDRTAVNATANWWGTNNPASTITNRNTGTTNISTFAQLTNIASPTVIKINQSSTLTGDLSKDNNGSAATLAGNLDVLAGLPITFNNPILGTIPQAQPESLNSSAQATATFNAGGTGGTGHADATVDQQTVTANITILEPLQITKSFSPVTVAVGVSSTLTFAVNNPNVIAVDASFTDTLPAGLLVAATPGVTNTCGGTVTAIAGSGSISSSNASLPVGACTITVKVSSATDNVYNNTVTINSTAAGTGALSTSSATLTVINPPSITEAFGAATIPLNGTASLTFTITNSNVNSVLNGIAFTDNLPVGLVVATPPGITSNCVGTASATAGSSSASLSSASLAPGASCTVSVNVQGTTAGVKNNSVAVSSTNGGTGNTSNASITVVGPPTISKAFGAASVPLNGSTSLSFTVTNPNTTVALTGVAFSDTLPAGLVISTPNGLTGTCGSGGVTTTAGSGTLSLFGGTIAASSSCTFSVNVTGTAAGTKNNTTGNVTSTEGGTGGTASASVNVVAPPSIAKVFNPSSIALNATTSLTFTITNPATNAVALTGVAFTDTLPTGLTVANASATVCGGILTTTAPTGIALAGGTIAANSQCQFSVTVAGAASGQYTNTTGAVTSTSGGTGNTATANLTVATPPAITKVFGAATIPLNGSTSLTFNIQNPNSSLPLTGLAFTDNLPVGLVVATPTALTSSCGGTATAVAGSSSVSLSAGTLAGSTLCTVSLNITGATSGVKNNSATVTSTEAGTGNTSNASLVVIGAPVIIKAFGAASVPLNGSTSLSFTIQNNNATSALSGVGFTDTFPSGLVISTPSGQSGTCGAGTITDAAGTNVISLSGATLAAGASCTFSVNVTGLAAGTQNNTTGNVTSTQGGIGGTASASISVVAPPSISKAFTLAGISPNGISGLSFTITNPPANTVALAGVAFTDVLPTGITIAAPNGLSSSCGGTTTAIAGSGTVTLSGASIAASGSCTLSVNVTGTTAGNFTNITGNVTSTNGGTGNTASATLTVATPPSIAKSFGAASLGLSGSTSLTFTITNANATLAMPGVAFSDALPAGLVVATPSSLVGTCGTGSVSAPAGAQSVSLAGGTIAASGSCSFSINVTATSPGTKVNTTGSVSAANAGTGNTATASVNVLAPDLSIAKSHTGNFFQGQTAATYTATINNAGPGPTGGKVTVIEAPPIGLTVTSLAGTGWSCNLGTLSCTRSDALASGASYPAITVTVSIAATAPASVTNSISVSGGGELNLANDTATDATMITAPPDFTLAASPATITIRAGAAAMYGLTLTPLNNNFTGAIALSATGLPAKTTLNFAPSSVTPGANPAASTLTVFTTPGNPFLANNSGSNRRPLFAILLPFWGIVLSGIGLRKRTWRRGKVGFFLAAVLLTCCGLALNGCASAQNFRNLGTPPGTYSITVTGVSGATQHTTTVTLVVQP